MKTLVALVVVALLTSAANADSVYTGLHTLHFIDNGQVYYEANNVFLYELDSGVSVGRMVNSFQRESFLFGYRHRVNRYVSTGVLLATGYSQHDIVGNGDHTAIPLLPMPFIGLEAPVTNQVSLSVQWVGAIVNTGVIISF